MSNKVKTPLFTTFKRFDYPKWKGILIRVGAVLLSFIFSLLICTLVIKRSPIVIFKAIIEGAFIRPWRLALDTVLFLGFGISIIPAFRMKYWNMGANGQVLVGCLVSVLIMYYCKDIALNESGELIKGGNFLLLMIMLAASILASVIWAVIPAIFKIYFNTNETLFTLMMNYIAAGLVSFVNFYLANGKQEAPGVINTTTHAGWVNLNVNEYLLPVLVIIFLSIFIYLYMTKTKHGYEVIVVGDSINTAKYVGMNTKKIMIRTIILSGVICGILGFLYCACIDHSVNPSSCGSLGFTAVLIGWLSDFNPIIMFVVSFFLAFLTLGTSKVSSKFQLGSNNLSSVIIGLIFFSILIAEFFIRYKLKFNFIKNKNKEEK